MTEDFIGIQSYFQDEWYNTKHTMESLKKEAKEHGDGELRQMYIASSWFEHDTYYYFDECGHTCLFRVVTQINKEYWKEE